MQVTCDAKPYVVYEDGLWREVDFYHISYLWWEADFIYSDELGYSYAECYDIQHRNTLYPIKDDVRHGCYGWYDSFGEMVKAIDSHPTAIFNHLITAPVMDESEVILKMKESKSLTRMF
jgi:hypothetical protein